MNYRKILSYEQIIYLKKLKAFFEDMPQYCDETKSIFIHIPKAAGMSVVKALYNKEASNHDTWREYRRRDKVKFNQYFKFGFVRHPVDRFISAYEYLMKGGKSEIDVYWRNKYLLPYLNIDSFILDGGLVHAINGGAEHFIPQVDFLCEGSRVVVDFIGRYENIENDYRYVQGKIGGLDLEVLNANSQRNYISLSESALSLLMHIYKQDFSVFEY